MDELAAGNIKENRSVMQEFLQKHKNRFPQGLEVFISDCHVEIRVNHPAVMGGRNCGDCIELDQVSESFKNEFEFKFNEMKRLINVWNLKNNSDKLEKCKHKDCKSNAKMVDGILRCSCGYKIHQKQDVKELWYKKYGLG